MIRLIIMMLIPIVLSGLFSFLDRKTAFKDLKRMFRQIIIGISFGVFCILSTEFGVLIDDGAVLNVRNAGPMCAGLIFGAPAGIIAGMIGGIERWFCVYWGGAFYTRTACSLATILAGFFAALIRKRLFDDEKPSIGYAFGLGIGMEVLDMLLVLILNINELAYAFTFVQKCAVPMIISNALALAISVMASGYIKKEEPIRTNPPYLIHDVGLKLFICVLAAFFATSLFTYRIHSELSESEAYDLLTLNLNDASDVMSQKGEEELIARADDWRIGQDGGIIILDKKLRIIGGEYNGISVQKSGIFSKYQKIRKGKCYKETFFGVNSYCMYIQAGGYYIVAYIPVAEASFFQSVSLYIIIFMEILTFVALYILIFELMKKNIVYNLKKINQGLGEITSGKLDTVIDVRSHQEFLSLSNDINATVNSLKQYITEAEAQMDKELEVARMIQISALPSLSQQEKCTAYELYASMDAAKDVGGDFYDYYMLNASTLVFIVADVSGKGIPAAMFMMRAKTLIKMSAESGKEVDEIFNEANKKLCVNNEADMFVTAWMGILNLNTGVLQFVNAGHNPPLFCRRGEKFAYLRTKANFVLAGMEGIRYKKQELQMQPGDVLCLYTDGITEAENTDGAFYGGERLLSLVNKEKKDSISKLCKDIKTEVFSFMEGMPQTDDITLLSIRLHARWSEEMVIAVPSTDGLKAVESYIDKKIKYMGLSEKIANKLLVTNDEVFSNIMHYGDASEVKVEILQKNEKIYLIFTDDGIQYNPLKAKNPDTTLSFEEREPGGLGIFMVKKMASDMQYQYKNKKNILTLAFLVEEKKND